MSVPLARNHRSLEVWQHADDLAQHVYRITWKFMQSDPSLAQRMRGAAITVGASIAEACRLRGGTAGRSSLQSAAASVGELGYYLHFARRAGLLGEVDLRRLAALTATVEGHLEVLLEAGGAAAGDGTA